MSNFVRSFFTTFDVDYHDNIALMNFGDKAPFYNPMRSWFNKFNCGRRSPKHEIREGPPKTTVVPENIDVVHELIMQDRHVTYREIEAYLGISSNNNPRRKL